MRWDKWLHLVTNLKILIIFPNIMQIKPPRINQLVGYITWGPIHNTYIKVWDVCFRCWWPENALESWHYSSFSSALPFLSVRQSAPGYGPHCGFNPTLPWPGSKDNEVLEVGTHQRRERSDITGWSAVSRNTQNGKRKLGIALHRWGTVFTEWWDADSNIYFATTRTHI